MRLLHFDMLKPICPACKLNSVSSSLKLIIDEEIEGDVKSGLLTCQSVSCGRSYPILFGCPIIVPDIATWLTGNLHLVLQQDIDGPNVENLVSEIISTESAFNITRQQQASYCADHYREEFSVSSNAKKSENSFSSIRRCLAEILNNMPQNSLPCIDLGCAVGGTTFDIAKNRNALTIGIDLNWPLLNIARKTLHEGIISFPHRIIGNKYKRYSKKVSYSQTNLCDFWIADALHLPFKEDIFGLAIALNIIDCLSSPQKLLSELLNITTVAGGISLSCPFDWVSHATSQSNWIYDGNELDNIISNHSIAYENNKQKIFAQLSIPQDINWSLPLHQRAEIHYLSRVYILQVLQS